MSEVPYIPLYVEPLLADTFHLSDAEFGLYMRVLCRMWLAPGARLPNDWKWLTRKLGTTEEQLRPIVEEFCQCDGNWITQKRLRAEHERSTRKRSARSVSAKARERKKKEQHELSIRARVSQPQPQTHKERSPNGDPKKVNGWRADPDFVAFKQVYPKTRPGSWQRAYLAWRQALDQGRGTAAEIQTGVMAYAASDEVARGYAKGAQAWLNDDRWTSDYSARPVNGHAVTSPGVSADTAALLRGMKPRDEADELANPMLPLRAEGLD